MSDDLQARGPRDRDRIDVREPWECRYWSRKYGVRPKTLKRAVRAAGDRPADVERWLTAHPEGTIVSGDHPTAPIAFNPE